MTIIINDAIYHDIDSAEAFVKKIDTFLNMQKVRADAGYVKLFELRRNNALKFIEKERLKLAEKNALTTP